MKTKKITFTALFAALTCVATMIIKVPTPGTGGYVHLGDAFVILSGIFLGPVYGALAAGLGSALSDLIGGYFIYVPITFVIKAIIAAVCALIYSKCAGKVKNIYVRCILCGIAASVIVAFGYFACEYFIYGIGAAASIPANFVQGISGLIISTILVPIFNQIKLAEYIND